MRVRHWIALHLGTRLLEYTIDAHLHSSLHMHADQYGNKHITHVYFATLYGIQIATDRLGPLLCKHNRQFS